MVLSIKDNILLFKVSNMSIKLQELSNDTTIVKHYQQSILFTFVPTTIMVLQCILAVFTTNSNNN